MNDTSAIPRVLGATEVERALHVRQGTCRYLVAIGVLKPLPLPNKCPKFTVEAVREALGLAPEPPERGASR